MQPCVLSPKAQGRPVPGLGDGLFAVQPIRAGETIVQWTGDVLDRAAFDRLDERLRANSLQVGDDAFLVPDLLAAGDHVNHGCDPNAGLQGDRVLVALREIAPGEEIRYDYATSDGCDYDEFACRCGAAGCRGQVRGDDWRLPELQQRLRGWFSPYLAARIAAAEALR